MARHFESVKRAVYNRAINSDDFSFIPLMDSVMRQTFGGGYHNKLKEARKMLNTALDRWDIRCVGQLIDALPQKGSGVASWIRNRQFVIDYNNRGELDLVRTDNLNN